MDGREIARSSVRYHPFDEFSYDKGRKAAIKKALESSYTGGTKVEVMSKAERASLWEDYRVSTKNPRWEKRVGAPRLVLTEQFS